MKKNRLAEITMILLSLSSLAPVFAETIILKSGEKFEVKVIEKTDDYIMIDYYGSHVNYNMYEIEGIVEEEKQVLPIPQEETLYQEYQLPIKSEETDDFQRIEESTKKEAVAYLNRGREYYDNGQYQQAIPYLQKAIEIDPNYQEAFAGLGYTYL